MTWSRASATEERRVCLTADSEERNIQITANSMTKGLVWCVTFEKKLLYLLAIWVSKANGRNKWRGQDDLLSGVMKGASHVIAFQLWKLFSKSSSEGKVTEDWKLVNVASFANITTFSLKLHLLIGYIFSKPTISFTCFICWGDLHSLFTYTYFFLRKRLATSSLLRRSTEITNVLSVAL